MMYLGIDCYSYHWAFGYPFPREYREYLGLTDCWFSGPKTFNLESFLKRSLELRADGVEIDQIFYNNEPKIVGLMKKYEPHFKYLNWSECQDYTTEGKEAETVIANSIKHLELAREVHASVMRFCTGGNRFLKEMSPITQLSQIIKNMSPVVKKAEELGIIIALENHADFMADEILYIINEFQSDYLKVNVDIGNGIPVCEDPYEAVKKLAPHAVTCHFKDWKVTPLTFFGAKLVGTPLGEGILDLDQMVDILAHHNPAPKKLRLNIEVMLEEGDEDAAVAQSMEYARELLNKKGLLTGYSTK